MHGECPKCGWHTIAGPTYEQDRYGNESLRYTCAQCGYSDREPTVDAKRREEALRRAATEPESQGQQC